nr:PDR/VanB family oxidoreductase [Nocardiopsis coralli]
MSGGYRGHVKHSSEYYARPRRPVSLTRGRGPDRFMLALERVARGIEPLTARLRPGHPIPEPEGERTVRVERVEHPAEGVAQLTLVPARPGETLPAWQPGQHVDVVLGGGVLRQYSLTGDPSDRSAYRIAVRRIPDGVGSGLVHGLREGDTIGLRGPRNAFPFTRAERYLFVAGGIGITPILPMVLSAHRAAVPARTVYTGRSRATMPFADLLPGEVSVRPDDECGPPDPAAIVEGLTPGTAVYVCGPSPLIEAVRARTPEGTPFFSERFAPAPVVDGEPFEVQLGEDGPVVPIPADESALEVMRRVRPATAYSCRQGFCGTCRLTLLSGEADHRDRPTGGSPRGEEFAPCVSRAAGGERLVLDV